MSLGMRGRRSGRSIDFSSCFGGCHRALFFVRVHTVHITHSLYPLLWEKHSIPVNSHSFMEKVPLDLSPSFIFASLMSFITY